MPNPYLSLWGTTPEEFGNHPATNRSWLMKRRKRAADWTDPKLETSTVIFRIIQRGHKARRRARWSIILLFFTIGSVLAYFYLSPTIQILISFFTERQRAAIEAEIDDEERVLIGEVQTQYNRIREQDLTSISGTVRPMTAEELGALRGDAGMFLEYVDQNRDRLNPFYEQTRDTAERLARQLASIEMRRRLYAETRMRQTGEANLLVALDALFAAEDSETRRLAEEALEIASRSTQQPDEWWRYFAERLPAAVLVIFFLVTLVSLFRYNTRIAEFHFSRADALELISLHIDQKSLQEISSTLAADTVDFRGAKAPVDTVTEVTKQVIASMKSRI